MSLLRRLAAALLTVAAAAPLAACPAAAAQNQKRMPDAPLDFDPAKPEPVEGWWTNGSDLLRLERNGAYQLWITQDRFKRPAEVGGLGDDELGRIQRTPPGQEGVQGLPRLWPAAVELAQIGLGPQAHQPGQEGGAEPADQDDVQPLPAVKCC